MICQRCLRGLQASRAVRNAASTTSQAQSSLPRFSKHLQYTQLRRSSTEQALSPKQSTASALEPNPAPRVTRPRSSVPVGQPLKGINFEKSKQDPIAKADSDYPEWLWTLLDRQAVRKDDKEEESDEAGLYSKSKKVKQAAARALRKKALSEPEAPRVPIHEQSSELPFGADGTLTSRKEAFAARAALTKSLRQRRRATIKETNYVKSMS